MHHKGIGFKPVGCSATLGKLHVEHQFNYRAFNKFTDVMTSMEKVLFFFFKALIYLKVSDLIKK